MRLRLPFGYLFCIEKSLALARERDGFLDLVTKDTVVGWAVERSKPSEVCLSVNGRVTATAKAKHYRPDLEVIGYPAEAGFVFELEEELVNGDEVAISFTNGIHLNGSPRKLVLETVEVESPKDRNGYLDLISKHVVYGWAIEGREAAEVKVHVNSVLLGSVKGGHYRSDLQDCLLPPEAGFTFDFPSEIEEGDVVNVTFLDDVPLKQSPKTLVSFPMLKPSSSEGSERLSSPLIFLHIPKTAGTSLRRLIDKQSPDRVSLYNGEVGDFDFLRAFRRSRAPSLIMGHIPYGTHQFLGIPPRYACLFRDPVERVYSFFRYCQVMPDPNFEKFKKMSVQELVDSCMTEQTNNHMCRICAGVSTNHGAVINERWLLDLALHNIKENFILIGITERIDDFVQQLGKMLSWADCQITRENVTRGERAVLDEAGLRSIRKHNALDIELYESVRASLAY